MTDVASDQGANDLSTITDIVDKSSYGLSILEDVDQFLFHLSEQLDEDVSGAYANDLWVCQHALAKAKEQLQSAHDKASGLYQDRKN